jgi:hypothetical protein
VPSLFLHWLGWKLRPRLHGEGGASATP